MKLSVYQNLLGIIAGFDQVIRGFDALRKNDAFLAKEIDRFKGAREGGSRSHEFISDRRNDRGGD